MAKDGVPGRVPDRVVDFLEVVEVAHDQGERLPRLPRPLQLAVKVSFQLPVVRHTGHGIGGGQLLGVLVGRGVFDRNHRLVGESLEHPNLAALEDARRPHVDDEHTDDLACQAHRNGNRPLQPNPPRGGQGLPMLIDQVEFHDLLRPLHPLRG